jgi:hypothetical protein
MLSIVATGGALALAFGGGLTSEIKSSAERAIDGQGTVYARFENWKVTVDIWRTSGVISILFGREPGSDTRRIIATSEGERRYISFSAHNNYVSILTGTGIIGLAALIWTLGTVFIRLYHSYRAGDEAADESSLLLVLMATQLTYYLAYSADYFQYVLLGVALAFTMNRIPESSPPSTAANRRGRFSPTGSR